MRGVDLGFWICSARRTPLMIVCIRLLPVSCQNDPVTITVTHRKSVKFAEPIVCEIFVLSMHSLSMKAENCPMNSANEQNPSKPAKIFSDLLASGQIVQAPGAPDSLAARLVQQAGFPAVYMTGFGATASRLGAPDIGLLTQTEMTEHARNMTRAVQIPVIADADTGYGGPSNLHRTVLEYSQAGVAAIHLEDQVAPKRCGQRGGIVLIPAAEAAARIDLACRTRDGHGGDRLLRIIARTDALPEKGLDEAVSRIERYRDAGADLVFIDGVKTVEQVEAIAHRVSAPKVISLVDGTPASELGIDRLQEMNFQLALYAVTTLFAATAAVRDALISLRESGRANAQPAITYDAFSTLVDLPRHEQFDEQAGPSS